MLAVYAAKLAPFCRLGCCALFSLLGGSDLRLQQLCQEPIINSGWLAGFHHRFLRGAYRGCSVRAQDHCGTGRRPKGSSVGMNPGKSGIVWRGDGGHW